MNIRDLLMSVFKVGNILISEQKMCLNHLDSEIVSLQYLTFSSLLSEALALQPNDFNPHNMNTTSI
jgi:hypothetical protein